MSVLAAILGILAAISVWYFRAQGAARGVDAAMDAAGHIKGAYNRRKFRNQTEGAVLANVTNPAEAAAVFLVMLAHERGPVSGETETLISAMLSDRAGLQGVALEDAMSFANWASDEVADGNDVIRRFLPLWRETLDEGQQRDLIDMAQAVASHDGSATPVQIALLRRLTEGLAPVR